MKIFVVGSNVGVLFGLCPPGNSRSSRWSHVTLLNGRTSWNKLLERHAIILVYRHQMFRKKIGQYIKYWHLSSKRKRELSIDLALNLPKFSQKFPCPPCTELTDKENTPTSAPQTLYIPYLNLIIWVVSKPFDPWITVRYDQNNISY